MFGREDIDVIAPVIESYRADGMDIAGPVPADTVYVKALAGQFDAVVAMYHDQGHIVVKTLGFVMDPNSGRMSALSGVNVTLGLPIVRTSVDHGTAFDIAGKGVANPQSMIEAIEVAARLVGARRPRWPCPVIRPARPADIDPLRALQAAAMRALGTGYDTPAQVEAAVRYVCVPDPELIEDGTYLVAELDGRLVGCGGWSLRRKAYAGPAESQSDAERLDPLIAPTRIRAMFTAPDVARQGVGRAILKAAEDAARAAGFRRARLGATLSGEDFYRRSGYVEIGRETAPCPMARRSR